MFTFSVAFKFFKSKKSQTILILMGFAIGIAVNIFVGSLIQSLQDDLIQTTVGTQPHITIQPVENITYVDQWQDIVDMIENYDGIDKYTTTLDGRAFIVNIHPSSPDDIIMRGTDLNRANQIYNFFDVDTFYGDEPKDNSEVVIGYDLADELEVNISDTIEVKVDPRPSSPSQNLTISGIFDLGVPDLNKVWVFSPYTTAETVFNVTDKVTGIYMQVDDIFAADSIAQDLQEMIDDDNLVITNWKETNASLLNGLQAQSSSTNIIQVFVLASVVIGIASVLSITVLQKSRQIGILKAMGLNDRRVAAVFLFQGLLYGIFGSMLGTLIGTGMIYSFNKFAAGESSGLFDIYIATNLVVITNIVAVLFSLLAAVIPARTSARMEVIDIIREN